MGGLNTSLTIATQSLLAQEAALQVTNNNIANANTPGYTRETVVLTESATITQAGVQLGDGATLQGFSSIRDQLLELRIQQQTSDQSSADAQSASLQQVQALFPSSGESLDSSLTSFFSSLSALSATPTSAAARQSALSSAQNLASQFNAVSSGLTSQQASLNAQVSSDVASINSLSSQIAKLNVQLAQLSGQGQNTGPVQDQLNALELNLSKLANVSVVHAPTGDTVTIGNGTALVLGDQSYALSAKPGGSAGLAQVEDSSGANLSSSITGGDLGGTLEVRDTNTPSLLNQADTLANQFANAINTAQASGYNQSGAAGGPIFSVPGTIAGSAAAIKVVLTDPAGIAASSDGSAGSNGNVANLVGVQTAPLGSGASPADTSASLTFQVGSLASNASANSAAIGVSLAQLSQQRSSVSGVSIDEESANLVRFQQSYEAAAKVISTIQTLFNVALNMGTAVGGS